MQTFTLTIKLLVINITKKPQVLKYFLSLAIKPNEMLNKLSETINIIHSFKIT